MRRSTVLSLVLGLAAGACASATCGVQPWLDPSAAKLARGGKGVVAKDKLEWTTFALPAGKSKTYEFDVETSVPLAGFDYALMDDAGKLVASDSASEVVHRIAVQQNDAWLASADVNRGWPSGSVETGVISPGAFRVYIEASASCPSVQFRLRFKPA